MADFCPIAGASIYERKENTNAYVELFQGSTNKYLHASRHLKYLNLNESDSLTKLQGIKGG